MQHMPLFVFMAGSPFFLKNFMHTLGHFDIYGCALAICLLLMPARSLAFVLSAALGSMILILIHHIHLLMYVPTIAVIVVLRYYLVQRPDRAECAGGNCSYRSHRPSVFRRAILWNDGDTAGRISSIICKARMADPTRTNLLSFAYIWYQPLLEGNLAIPGSACRQISWACRYSRLLIWLHTPLWRYFAELIRSLADDLHRRIVIAAIVAVSFGYLIMFAIVFDYSRWISNWAVCMFLILHAVKTLPASKAVPSIATDDRKTSLLGWIVTLVPRVGIVRPF